MIVSVEGPDCAGKSTLINNVKDVFQFDVFKIKKKGPISDFDRRQIHLDFYEICQKYVSKKLIIDRGPVSNFVYSDPEYREYFKNLLFLFADFNIKFLFLEIDDDVFKQRIVNHNHPYSYSEYLVHKKYYAEIFDFMKKHHFEVYKFKNNNIEDQKKIELFFYFIQ